MPEQQYNRRAPILPQVCAIFLPLSLVVAALGILEEKLGRPAALETLFFGWGVVIAGLSAIFLLTVTANRSQATKNSTDRTSCTTLLTFGLPFAIVGGLFNYTGKLESQMHSFANWWTMLAVFGSLMTVIGIAFYPLNRRRTS